MKSFIMMVRLHHHGRTYVHGVSRVLITARTQSIKEAVLSS